MNHTRSATAFIGLVTLIATARAQNLLRNPGFETVPNGNTGQAILPSEWYADESTPDTYSNDGSYGLSPSDYGNFPGLTAHAGLRWVAGATFPESIGQIPPPPSPPDRPTPPPPTFSRPSGETSTIPAATSFD